MEYVKGGTLWDVAQKLPKLTMVFTYLQMLMNAVEMLHSRQICHLGIKPRNVMVGEKGISKLIDFGNAQPTLKNITERPIKVDRR